MIKNYDRKSAKASFLLLCIASICMYAMEEPTHPQTRDLQEKLKRKTKKRSQAKLKTAKSKLRQFSEEVQEKSKAIKVEDVAKPVEPPAVQAVEPPIPCQLFSTQKDDITKRMIQDIQSIGAGGYIGLESPYISNSAIINALMQAAQRGAHVRIFTNQDEKQLKELLLKLENTKIQVVPIKDLHSKRLVVNSDADKQKIVWIGSMNMSERSPENYEIMIRCTDSESIRESIGSQYRLATGIGRQECKVDFNSRRIISSTAPEAQKAKIQVIEEFAHCNHPHDYLYFVAYTLDDSAIIEALIAAKTASEKPIFVVLDRKNWINHHLRSSTLKPLVDAGIKVYVFNKNEDKKTKLDYMRDMHIKAILRKCNQQCLALISTANFTPTGRQEVNHDFWEPCSLQFSAQLKTIIEIIIADSLLLTQRDFPSALSLQQKTQRLLELMRYPNNIYPNKNEIVRLIKEGADIHAREKNHAPLLMKAVNADQPEIVQALIDAGAKVNFVDEYGQTALQHAARNGFTDIVWRLFEANAQINFADNNGNTALFLTIPEGHTETAQALIEFGADVNLPGDYRQYGFRNEFRGTTPPIVWAAKYRQPRLMQLLINAGAQLDAADPEGMTALWHAIQIGDLESVGLLAKAGANLNILHPRSGVTPLISAVKSNNYELIKTLLSANANLNARDNMGKAAMYYAKDERIRGLLEEVRAVRGE